MQIPDQSTNPYPIHQSLPNPQIQCQTITNMSIHFPCTNLHIHCQSANPLQILQSNANPDQPTHLPRCSSNLDQSPYQMAIQYQSANPWKIHQPNANLGTNHQSTYPRPISQTMTNLWPICQFLVRHTNAFTQKIWQVWDQFTKRLPIVCQYLANPSPMLQFKANPWAIHPSNAKDHIPITKLISQCN